MPCLGVHFALLPGDLERVRAAVGDDSTLLRLVHQDIEERHLGDHDRSFESDATWLAIHLRLTIGDAKESSEPEPWSRAVLDGTPLDSGDDDLMYLVDGEELVQTATALRSLSKDDLPVRYDALEGWRHGIVKNEDAFAATWEDFDGLRDFLERAANAGCPVFFTADR
ncbi:MAG: DUF1877 family protein [Planctomycetota bacterium]